MLYLITFLEGLISFISPCMLPMLPIYISYFAGGGENKKHTVLRSLFFCLGFTLVFTAMGLFAGVIGGFLRSYQTAVNIVTGVIVILFGLSYLEIIRLPFFKGLSGARTVTNVFSAFLFGAIYSVSLTPCVGAFLGSALMMASSGGQALEGGLLLLTYSLGLGVPFVLSALLIDRLSTLFNAIKRHYRVINLICGIFLIIVGLAMCFGLMTALLGLFA